MPLIAQEIRRLERVEIAAWADLYRAGQELVPRPGGVQMMENDHRLISLVPQCDILAMNRVIGLGQTKPIKTNTLREIIDIYHKAGAARFFVQLHPETVDASTLEQMTATGFEPYNNWVKLTRPAAPLEVRESDLEVDEISRDEAASFARIVASCFEWDAKLLPWLEAIVGRPNWRCYLAYDGDKPVATGVFYHYEDSAWIDLLSSRPLRKRPTRRRRRIETCSGMASKKPTSVRISCTSSEWCGPLRTACGSGRKAEHRSRMDWFGRNGSGRSRHRVRPRRPGR
jgi:hypothetical protein